MATKKDSRLVQSYLFFDGKCEEALEYYRQALDAKVTELVRFKDSPEPAHHAPGADNKVMHANFSIGDSQVMASDGRCEGKPSFQGFALTLNVPNEAEAEKRFAALAEGGKVQMPLGRTFFSPKFGMVSDRFGVTWMVIVEPKEAGTPAQRR
jgi:PhnB protein